MAKHLFTSESVTAGHPDKVCDCISDAVLDSILEQDKNAHVACETTVTTGMVLIMGEISTTAKVDVAAIARKVINTVKTNITFALAVKAAVIILAALGLAAMWMSVLADTGVCVICVLYTSRLLRMKY